MRLALRWSHGFMDGWTMSNDYIAGPRRAHFPSWPLQPRVKAYFLCSPPPPHLSRLQLQDRIRIVPLDITSGTSPLPIFLGVGILDRGISGG